jgi:hypothetical protein
MKHFFTSFEHLSAHFGIRKGCYSIYMGTTSCGKSSLLKTIAVQASTTPGVTVLIWLSEEKKAKYAKGMDLYCKEVGADLGAVKFFEESSLDMSTIRTHEDFLATFRDVVVASGADIVFIDNITTSKLYGSATSLSGQGQTVTFFKRITQDLDIAIVAVSHTSSDVSDNMGRLFTTEDVRGLKAISLEASYFYSLQKFTSNGEIFLTLRVLKFRDHDQASGSYLLKYDPRFSVYTGDVKVPFETINEIFKKRDALGRK